ncbi:nucleotidyltransferase domain-containing protein [bacterium]|nr:nucleotidyltransferase domain-containing protein [bacterium]MBU1882529.1 nucleotidyltransferase domain-containing protein [bacterium]
MSTLKDLNEELSRILAQLIEKYNPERVILFGSLAANQLSDGSDIDLFIIKSDVPELGVDRIRQLDRMINYRIATDFVVYKPEEFDACKVSGDPFIEMILNSGKVLYEAA